MLLARLTTGSSWPWATALLWLSGAALYGLGLRLSPLKATLAQDLLGLRNRAQAPGQAAAAPRQPGHPGPLPAPPLAPADALWPGPPCQASYPGASTGRFPSSPLHQA